MCERKPFSCDNFLCSPRGTNVCEKETRVNLENRSKAAKTHKLTARK